MARVRWNKATLPSYVDSMYSNTEDWQYIRKAPELITFFDTMGTSWVSALNQELHAAQRARKQPVADGYAHAITVNEDRIRMRIWCTTARAMAHEAKHQSMLRTMSNSGFDFKAKGRARFDWGGKKGKSGGSKSGRGRKSSAKPGGTNTRPSGSRPAMDPRREASLRRKLAALEALATEGRGGTESERKSAAEKARRIRSELGE